MLQYITVFDPSRSCGENDMHKQLLLYHSFKGSEISLNDKLGRIGIIQGIWSLTKSLSSLKRDDEKIIELEGEVILIIQVESSFYICLSISSDDDSLSSSIPHQFYLAHMWYCYQFFTLEHGLFQDFEDAGRLTDLLNEQFILFWNDISLKPEAIIRRGITGLWPHAHKVAELEFETSEETWEASINQNILLDPENYLGIKDILVYHLPSQNSIKSTKKSKKLGAKTYGLVRNFSTDLKIVTQLSNWIYHMHAVYDNLSSHVLAGNAHYKEAPTEVEAQQNNEPNQEETSSTGAAASNSSTNLQEHGNMFFHNLTLPISFAYDAVQEVGSTTGISNSISLLMDYVPKWGKYPQETGSGELVNDHQFNKSRYGYLISPLCAKMLPMAYKIKRVRCGQNGESKIYNLLFWYYDDVLAVIVCEPTFNNIWEPQYLGDLSYKLCTSIEQFYATAFKFPKSAEKRAQKKASFAYSIYNKKSKEIESSIPSWYDTIEHDVEISPLNLVINGVDQLFGNATSIRENQEGNKWGIDIMGSLFGLKSTEATDKTVSKKENPIEKTYENFLDCIPQEKLWELQLQILQYLMSLRNTNKTEDITEERLLKLNNGVLCYIKNNENGIVIIVKNWYENEEIDGKTLFTSLGKEVSHWWALKSRE